jgi:GNAT superfamily N-acetyltransferase
MDSEVVRRRTDLQLIRPARPDEASLLSELAMRSKGHWGYDDAFLLACTKELTVSEKKLAHNPGYVIEDSGRLVGFYTLEPRSENEAELGYLFVEPDAIGCGYGGRLMRHAKSTASALGYKTMLIQGDPHAEPVYCAMGGKKIGTKVSASIPGRALPLFKIDLTKTAC